MKITLNNVGSLIDATTAAATINANNAVIQTAFDNTLSRDGTSPNTLTAPLDVNSQQVLNLPAPVGANSPLRLQDLSDFVGGGTVTNIPVGGTTGQVLAKNSNTNYDIHWISEASDLIGGSNISITGTSPATISTSLTPTFTTVNTATIPTVVDTLVGRNTTDTLTNKTLTSPVLVTPALGTPASGVATNLTGTAAGLTAGNVTTNASLTGAVTSSGNFTTLGSFTSANLRSALTDETGTGVAVFASSPALVTPTGIVKGDVGLGNVDNTSDATKNAAAVTLTNKTLTSPILTTPALGTPASGVLTNCTGTASGLTAGTVTTNANLTGPITSVGNTTSVASQTGTGTKFVMDTSPTLVTPLLGTPTSGVLTNCTGTASGLTSGNVTTNANLTGDVTSVGNATTLTNASVIAKVLTGYTSGAGTVASTDSILQAIQKLNGNDGLKATVATPTFTTNITSPIVYGGSGAASTLTFASTSGAGTTDSIIFQTASQSNRMIINTSGNVGIGLSAVNIFAKLAVGSDTAGYEISSPSGIQIDTYNRTGSSYVGFKQNSSSYLLQISNSAGSGVSVSAASGLSVNTATDAGAGNILLGGILKYSGAPTAVSGAGPFLTGSGSTLNNRMKVNLNGTDYWIPCSTTAF